MDLPSEKRLKGGIRMYIENGKLYKEAVKLGEELWKELESGHIKAGSHDNEYVVATIRRHRPNLEDWEVKTLAWESGTEMWVRLEGCLKEVREKVEEYNELIVKCRRDPIFQIGTVTADRLYDILVVMASGLDMTGFKLLPKLFSQFHSFFIKFAVFDIHSYSSPLIFVLQVHTITGSTPAIVVFPRNHFHTFSLGQVVSITTWYSSTRSLRNSLSIEYPPPFYFQGITPPP